MKRIVLLSPLFNLTFLAGLLAQSTDDFVTTWKTDNPGGSGNTFITIPTYSGETYNYDADWNNDGTFDDFGVMGDVTHNFGSAGTYTIRIRGVFPRIYFNAGQEAYNPGGDERKLLQVNQWGTIAWSSMESAFSGCENLQVTAMDSPNLSNVSSTSYMFSSCYQLTGNSSMNNWNVSNVTDMSGMFYFTEALSVNLNSWQVGNVTNMYQMFSYSAFNQPLNGWTVSSVTDMSNMFNNGDFDQDLSSWDVGNVTNMSSMFEGTPFNQPLNSWDVGMVTNMFRMFKYSLFNQDLSNWDVSSVTNMSEMFYGGVFNQDIGSWDISSVTIMEDMFTDATPLSTANYDALLIGWNTLEAGETQIPQNITFSAGTSTYCAGTVARASLTVTHGWSITDGGIVDEFCDPANQFVTTWKTDNLSGGSSGSTFITIPTNPNFTYNYKVDWDNDGIFDQFGFTGNATHDFGMAGTYTIRIGGDFPSIYFNAGGDRLKILSVNQWGSIAWASMEWAFSNCFNLTIPATDAPDLSGVTNVTGMFLYATSFNQYIGHWDVSNVVNMFVMFAYASSFNQHLSGWDVSHVTNMEAMFGETAFDQDLSSWDISNVTNMDYMFSGTSLSTANYDALLAGWNTLDPGETKIPVNIPFDGGNSYYCDGNAARQSLINTYGWNITDAGVDPTCLALPVELVSFSGSVRGNLNHLTWVTASEENAGYFEIERSENDGRDWEVIGEVEAMGNTTADHSYRFDDTAPPARAYYRLRMIDLGGSFEYSNVIFLKNALQLDEPFRVYPNPTSGLLYFQWPSSEGLQARLFDATGQLLLSANDPESFELSALPAGIYLLQVSDHRGQPIANKRVVKQ